MAAFPQDRTAQAGQCASQRALWHELLIRRADFAGWARTGYPWRPAPSWQYPMKPLRPQLRGLIFKLALF